MTSGRRSWLARSASGEGGVEEMASWARGQAERVLLGRVLDHGPMVRQPASGPRTIGPSFGAGTAVQSGLNRNFPSA